MKVGIACASGSAKGVFVHGVLAGFAEDGFEADLYASSSSSSIPAAFAASRQLARLGGVDYWRGVNAAFAEIGFDVSRAVKAGIQIHRPALREILFEPASARFAVAVSAVVTDEAERQTQGPEARRLGQRLMMSIRKKDRSWADENLEGMLFDTRSPGPETRLYPGNLAEVLYATTRMLHAWKDPAWIGGKPYVDASYTCMCPAVELAKLGCEMVVAVTPESGPLYRDFFQSEVVPGEYGGVRIDVLRPERNLAEIGVDYMKATDDGLAAAYELGKETGRRYTASSGA